MDLSKFLEYYLEHEIPGGMPEIEAELKCFVKMYERKQLEESQPTLSIHVSDSVGVSGDIR